MLFGYGSGVVGGFLLTAIPNWTGRLPVAGVRLMALFVLWCLGRIALLATGVTGALAAVVIDSLFLPCLLIVMGREIVAGENWRNLLPLVLIAIFAIATPKFSELRFRIKSARERCQTQGCCGRRPSSCGAGST